MTEDAPDLLSLALSKMRGKGPKCSLGTLLKSTDRKDLDQLLANTGDSGQRIHYSTAAEVINQSFNTKFDGSTISRHQRGRCGCEPA